MLSFDVVNLSPSVPVDITLNVVIGLLEDVHSLPSRTTLSASWILEFLTGYVTSVSFWCKDCLYTQK